MRRSQACVQQSANPPKVNSPSCPKTGSTLSTPIMQLSSAEADQTKADVMGGLPSNYVGRACCACNVLTCAFCTRHGRQLRKCRAHLQDFGVQQNLITFNKVNGEATDTLLPGIKLPPPDLPKPVPWMAVKAASVRAPCCDRSMSLASRRPVIGGWSGRPVVAGGQT